MNKLFLGFFLISIIPAFSQTKNKVVDTVFVHEKVFVYKKNSKKTQKTHVFDSVSKNKFLDIKHFETLPISDRFLLKNLPKKFKETPLKKQQFKIDKYGVCFQSLFSKQIEIKSFGAGIGVFARKNIYKNKLAINIEFLFSKIFSLSDSKSFDGYFITPNEVMFYKPQNIQTQQLSFPITLLWSFGKIKPLIGFAYTQKQSKLDFFSYPNNTELTTIQETTYKIKNDYIDFIYGIDYDITRRIGISIKSKKTILKINSTNNPSESIKTLEYLHFFPNQITIGLFYNFKK